MSEFGAGSSRSPESLEDLLSPVGRRVPVRAVGGLRVELLGEAVAGPSSGSDLLEEFAGSAHEPAAAAVAVAVAVVSQLRRVDH